MRHQLLQVQNRERNTPVHWATVYTKVDTLRKIIDSLPPEDMYKLLGSQNYSGYTPLHFAAHYNRTEVLKLFINFIIENHFTTLYNAKCHAGNTLLHVAIQRGSTKVLKTFMDEHPSEILYPLLATQNNFGQTVVHLALNVSPSGLFTELMNMINRRIIPENKLELLQIRQDKGENTAVHSVAYTDEVDKMECLLKILSLRDQKVILELKNVNHLKPVEIAEHCGIRSMVSLIYKYMTETDHGAGIVLQLTSLLTIALQTAILANF